MIDDWPLICQLSPTNPVEQFNYFIKIILFQIVVTFLEKFMQ